MAFVLGSSNTYRWPVVISWPEDEAMHEERFIAVFHRLPHDRAMEIIAVMNRVAKSEQREDDPTESGLAREIMAGWDEVLGADQKPLPFTSDNLTQLLTMEFVPFQLLTAWAESKNKAKQAEAKRKN